MFYSTIKAASICSGILLLSFLAFQLFGPPKCLRSSYHFSRDNRFQGPAIRHNVWQLQQIGQTIAKVFHFCPLFVSLNTSLSGNLHTFSSPFQRYPTCLISVRACCWSTVLWTARRTWRRRPGRLLTLGCINSVGIFFNEDVIQPWIHWPPWSSFPGCSRRPKCRRPPTHMSLMLSHMLEIWRKKTVRHLEQAIYE